MKKYAAAVLAFMILITLTIGTNSYAGISSGSRNTAGLLETVRYDSNGSSEAVSITMKNYTDYSTMELSDPSRIVLDIYNVELQRSQQTIKTEGKIIERIRYAQFEPYTARVVLDVKNKTAYWVEKTDSGLVIHIGEKTTATVTPSPANPSQSTDSSNPANPSQSADPSNPANPSQSSDPSNPANPSRSDDGYPSRSAEDSDNEVLNKKVLPASGGVVSKNIEYHNNNDRVHFILYDVALTRGDEFLEELYTGEYDESGKKYTMTFATGESDLGNGIMEINDAYLRSVEIKTDKVYGTTTLTFNGTGRNTYFAYTRGTSGVTSITVIRPADDAQKLVVIDAGHGGVATGAVYRNLLEKDLNLDIAKRLNGLLKKKGIETYMLREDDSSMGNYERAYIANHLNAKLYLSVHNNAMDNRNYRGTMTLYCPSDSQEGFTGKSFAGVIQQTLLGSLKTIDRKVISRPDLIVLKATNMPAALVEVGYMTNISDRSNLQKTTYRQKVAQALCDSIMKARAKVK